MNDEIQNQYKAFVRFQDYLTSIGTKILNIEDYHKGRHRVIKTNSLIYYVVYKRDFFQTFNSKFESFVKNYPVYAGLGESLNKERLDTIIRLAIDEIVFIHPEGFYSIDPKAMHTFCNKFNLIRVTDKDNKYKQLGGEYSFLNETTYSYPKCLLLKWKI